MNSYFNLLDKASLFEVSVRLSYAQLEKLWEAYPCLKNITNNHLFLEKWKERNVILTWDLVYPSRPQSNKFSAEIETSTGFKHGLLTVYNGETNLIKYTKKYRQQTQHGLEIWYHQNTSNIKSKVRWVNGLKQGLEETWNEHGFLETTTLYKDNLKDGLSRCYKDGKRWLEEYKNNNLHGKVILWYDNGQRQSEYNYREDVANSRRIEWYSNGIRKSVYTVVGGWRHGKLELWDSNGVKQPDVYYDRGVMID